MAQHFTCDRCGAPCEKAHDTRHRVATSGYFKVSVGFSIDTLNEDVLDGKPDLCARCRHDVVLWAAEDLRKRVITPETT